MSAVRKKLYFFWKKLAEKQTRKSIADVHFKEDIRRFNASTNRKPAATIKREMKELHNYWGCFPFQYYRFDFFLKDCPLTMEEMKKYVPHYFLFNLFYPLSFKDYGILCEDKLLSYAMLKSYDLPQPRLLACFDNNNRFYDAENTPIGKEDLDQLLSSSSAGKLFVKPRFGVGGKGIHVFKKEGGRFVNEDGTALNSTFFTEELKGSFYIVQEGLEQHEAINQIYSHSVNTFRIVTECVNGEAKILYSIIRMGSGGQQVDNASSGGIYIRIDSETGRLADFAYTTSRSTFNAHPDTGFVFKDAPLKDWEKTKALALEAAVQFREIRYLGWDLALSTDGPSIIEFNNHPGISIVQDCYGGIRDDLKIVPKDWWYQSNYTLKNL